MTSYVVQVTVQILSDPADARPVSDFAAAVAAHLADALHVPTDVQSGEPGHFAYWMTLTGATPTDAIVRASTLLRTAAHASGFTTSGWPDVAEVVGSDWKSRLVELSVEAHAAREGLVPA